MRDDLVIRDFRPRDLPAVIALNMGATNPGASDRADNLPASLRHYPELLHVPSAFQRAGAFLVGTAGGKLAVMGAIAAAEPGVCAVRHVRVANAHQRRGYARRLMEAIEARAAALGAHALVLDTTVWQIPAQRLHESPGFVETQRETINGSDGREYALVYYRKRIA